MILMCDSLSVSEARREFLCSYGFRRIPPPQFCSVALSGRWCPGLVFTSYPTEAIYLYIFVPYHAALSNLLQELRSPCCGPRIKIPQARAAVRVTCRRFEIGQLPIAHLIRIQPRKGVYASNNVPNNVGEVTQSMTPWWCSATTNFYFHLCPPAWLFLLGARLVIACLAG